MNQIINKFISKVIATQQTGHAREHSYRPALEELFRDITGLKIVNEPKRSEFGAPDFVFINKNIVTAYAEAKDINVSLVETEKGEQMGRYYGYSNIILTNCMEFRFYRNGQEYAPAITIAKLNGEVIETDETKFQFLEDTIKDFIKDSKEPIKSGKHLAKVMAGKARRIRDNIRIFLTQEDDVKNENLFSIYEVIKKLLLADLDKEKFADMYAQTVVYGLFAARYYDQTPDTFSRQEARDLLPASNPFLRHFFDHIAGPSFDPRIEIIVNELCEEFCHADVQAIIHNYYKVEKDDSRDPIIHFYEDFLQEYDSSERKKMGVFYTPLPVVRFIVRAIDDILKRDFGLPKGLADAEKIQVKKVSQGKNYKEMIHRVQVLDPATGTGTFLNETILHIKKSFVGQEGRWNNYVNEDLLPRLHGFELMMASYTIAHLKLSSTIIETGAKLEGKARLGVYLTNSLEKGETEEQTLFSGLGLSKAISDESHVASQIKHDLPIMVVLGNPPYSGVSSNETKYANSLVDKYKIEPGGKQKLQERKHWLNDDYVKFIAFAEDMIEKNGEGIVGFITNHGYLSNPTFRGMRWHLMDIFDSLYVIDLHGNSKKKESAPDKSKDENVFNIQQGVSIILAIKNNTKRKNALAKVNHFDIWGKRDGKFEQLNNLNLNDIKWTTLDSRLPNLFFVPEGSHQTDTEYKKGFSINDLFTQNTTGVVTMGDGFIIDENKNVLERRVSDFLLNNISEAELKEKFNLGKNYGKWIIKNKTFIRQDQNNLVSYTYRPFDDRWTYFDNKLVWRPRTRLMSNFISRSNIGLVASKINRQISLGYFFVTKQITDFHVLDTAGDSTSIFPLYLHHEDGTKTPNLKKEIVTEIGKTVGQTTPEDILDYTYAALHSVSYREKFKEFLKIDFPRVPYPKDKETFFALVKLGRELRGLHLLESPRVNEFITTFSEAGSDTVEKKFLKFRDGNVYINETQYFGNVPEEAWNFYIGGYQPAQKWLKDRQGRKLTNGDIEHYQKMIVSLAETDRVMREIDKIELLIKNLHEQRKKILPSKG